MAKMRIHELSKQIDVPSKEIIEILKKKGVEVATSSNSISDEDAEYVKNIIKTKNEKQDNVPGDNVKSQNPEDEKSSEKKPAMRVIYTKKGVVYLDQDGNRVRRPAEGERRMRPDGERRRRPNPDPRKRPADAPDKAEKKDSVAAAPIKEEKVPASVQKQEEVKKTAPAETKENVSVINEVKDVQGQTAETTNISEPVAVQSKADEKKEEAAVVTETKSEVNSEKPADKKENSAEDKKSVNENAGQRRQDNRKTRYNDDRQDSDRQRRRDDRQDGDRQRKRDDRRDGDRQNRRDDRRDGDRQNRRDDRQDNRTRYQDGRQTRDDRFRNDNQSRPFDKDNRGNRDNFRSNDRRNDRKKNDSDRTVAVDAIAQDKNRKYREDKIRQDKQERNRRDYDSSDRDGRRQGKKGIQQNKNTLHKPEHKKPEPKVEEIKVITIPETLTIAELAEKMKMQPSIIIKKLFLEGKIVTINTDVDFETAESIALEYEIMCEKEIKVDAIEELLKEEEEDEAVMVKRPPVVCVMGHVDHGKTSLLDAIRETNVISDEAGGITQHIGAYVVQINNQEITFLDTPGHEAFTSMRMRGAQSTDIAVLVVAADDGVMPQTVEAINHAKAAEVEIIVAINKIDKPGANIDRVKKELAEHELLTEDWGGSTVCVPVSAKTGEGISDLLEMILLQADVLELKANPDRLARGIVIEARLDKGRGPVATVLVQKGTLKTGEHIAAGATYGRVRAMLDDKGRKLKTAGPSTPVEILGLDGAPNAGEVFVATASTNDARQFAETFITDSREKLLAGTKSKLSLDDLYSQIQAGDVKELNIVIKADVQGSVEAVKQSLLKLSNDEVVVNVIHGGVGAINESDIILASASNAIVIGFNTVVDSLAKDTAAREQVDVRLYNVIYNAIDDIEAALKGMLDPVYEEKIIAHAEIRQTFKASGVGTIGGAYVLDGVITRNCSVRVTRDGKQIYEGALASLKRFQDDVKEVKSGFECGVVLEKFNDLAEGDMVEAYTMVEVAR